MLHSINRVSATTLLLIFAYVVLFTDLSASEEYPAFLGNGYDSLRLEKKLHQCNGGEFKKIEASEAIVQFNKVESWHRLSSQLNFHIPGSIFLKSDTELGKFVLRARDSHLTSTYILTSRVSIGKEVLANPVGIIADSDEDFSQKCGTQYISLIETGGELHVGIKFSFSEENQKEKFDGGGSITSVTGLGSHVKSLSKEIKRNSSVEIFFHQIGGDLHELDDLFNSKDIIACSLENFEPCERLIANIWTYSTDQFAKAILEGNRQTISFSAADYAHRPRAFEDPKVIRERRHLLDALSEYEYDRDVLAVMLLTPDHFENCAGRCLSTILSHVSSNIRDIREAIRLSFLDPERFLSYGQLDQLDLYEYLLPKISEKQPSRLRRYSRYVAIGMIAGIVIPVVYRLLQKVSVTENTPIRQ